MASKKEHLDKNYLTPHLVEFFKEVSYFNGNLYVVESLIKSRSEQISIDFPVYQDLFMTGTYYRDLSKLAGGANLFTTGFGYDVSTTTISEQSSRSISYVCCASISNVYEVFDSYLKNILASVYINTDHKDKFKLKDKYNSFEEIRQNLWTVKSDKGFLKILRRISPFFTKYEKENIWKYNIGTWYNMIDKIRHQIVHNRQILSKDFVDNLNKTEEGTLFNKNFSLINSGNSYLISITYQQASIILNTFMEYAHLIFKSLSKDLGMNDIYDYMKKNGSYTPLNVYSGAD